MSLSVLVIYLGCVSYVWLCSCVRLQSFLYLAWYMTMSFLGHYNNFFFAAHLLDIAMGFKTLRTILSSVTHNGKQVCVCAFAYLRGSVLNSPSISFHVCSWVQLQCSRCLLSPCEVILSSVLKPVCLCLSFSNYVCVLVS